MFTASVQLSRSVVSNSLRPHEPQHARSPCPPPTPGVHSDSRPSSQWCHPAISSSVVPFSSCPQSLPASQSFQMSQLFAWSGQSTGVSASASVLPMNTQDWSPLGWTGWFTASLYIIAKTWNSLIVHEEMNGYRKSGIYKYMWICLEIYMEYIQWNINAVQL